jgi:subtilisin family serine protease
VRFKTFGLIVTLFLLGTFMLTAITPVSGAPDDTVRVWVTYQSGRKAEVFQALSRENAKMHYDFPQLEAYVVSLPAAALNGILRNPFVVGVEGDPERTPVEPMKVNLEALYEDDILFENEVIPWGVEAVQAREIWDTDDDGVADGAVDGTGIRVCIIDTGYYGGHEDLKDVDDDDEVTGMSQVDDDWTRDGGAHGSHVAGTVSALNNGLGVVGVTPGTVDLHNVKIFDDSGAWVSKARASDLTAAIYSCQEAGANVISMSLSGTGSNTKEQAAFDELYAAGILHIAAASNDHVEGEEIDPYHYPASYESVVSVAAVDSNLEIASFSQRNDAVEIAAPGVDVLSTIPYRETNSVTVDETVYLANHIEFSAYGETSGALVDGDYCFESGDWAGKIVLCQRGTTSFLEKVTAAYEGGGIGVIVYNNEPGDFFGTLGEEPKFEIVAVSISQEAGQYLVANKLNFTATISSVFEWPVSNYEAWAGTSMATPHVSGVAALIWSANPAWTNIQIREALTSTAIDLGDPGRDVVFGFGFIQAAEALEALGGTTPPPPPDDQLVVEITSPERAQQFADKDTVLISVLVTDGTNPVEGAAVSVSVEGPKFNAKTFSGTTGADGCVSFSYRINARKTGSGQYTIDVTATKDGYLPGYADSIFTVS